MDSKMRSGRMNAVNATRSEVGGGVVVGGVGYGTATCKTPAVSWSVTVK